MCWGRSKVRAKSAPDPAATTPSTGRMLRSSAISPLTTSFTVPSPPAATTVAAPARPASIASSVAWPGWLVALIS